MKKLAVLLMAVGMFSALPAFAADHEGMKMDTKDGIRECAMQAETIQQKVTRLQSAVSDGSKKYSAKDLKKLKAKLKETNDLLDKIDK